MRDPSVNMEAIGYGNARLQRAYPHVRVLLAAPTVHAIGGASAQHLARDIDVVPRDSVNSDTTILRLAGACDRKFCADLTTDFTCVAVARIIAFVRRSNACETA